MPDYEVVVGLEVHAQLSTASKLFCSCSTRFGAQPNENVCAICSGMPGTLPVLNQKAVEYAARTGLALNCTVNASSVFARKNYFYPDLPAGYQISQYEKPICEHGYLDIETEARPLRVGITRIHLENDAGKNIHSSADNSSYVDLNRAGMALIEIVSEPDMRSAEEAVAFLKALHAILVHLKVCDGNMEEGSFRCDANVSIRPKGQEKFGTRAELKNLNSFRNVQRAITQEVIRQRDILEDGGVIVQETRLDDASKNVTQSRRDKEDAHDYRYFPDPDLLPVEVRPEDLARWKAELPELPQARMERFAASLGLPRQDAEQIAYEPGLADFFEAALKANNAPKKIANILLGSFMRELNQRGLSVAQSSLRPEAVAELVRITDEGMISAKIGSDIFSDLFEQGAMPEAFVKERGLIQVSDSGALEEAVDRVIAENPTEADAFRGGKTKLLSFFVGQVMRATKGKANPALVNELLNKKLNG